MAGSQTYILDTAKLAGATSRDIYNNAGTRQYFGFPCQCPVECSHPYETSDTWIYSFVAGVVTASGEPVASLPGQLSFSGGWCEYYTPEHLMGF